MNRVPFAGMIVMAIVASGCALSAGGGEQESSREAREAESSCFCVHRVESEPAIFGRRTRFRVIGEDLPKTTAFWVDQCRDVQRESWSDSMVTFSCIPSYEVGIKKGVVKPYSGAPVQYTFEVDVENPD